eukprot:g4259.t1
MWQWHSLQQLRTEVLLPFFDDVASEVLPPVWQHSESTPSTTRGRARTSFTSFESVDVADAPFAAIDTDKVLSSSRSYRALQATQGFISDPFAADSPLNPFGQKSMADHLAEAEAKERVLSSTKKIGAMLPTTSEEAGEMLSASGDRLKAKSEEAEARLSASRDVLEARAKEARTTLTTSASEKVAELSAKLEKAFPVPLPPELYAKVSAPALELQQTYTKWKKGIGDFQMKPTKDAALRLWKSIGREDQMALVKKTTTAVENSSDDPMDAFSALGSAAENAANVLALAGLRSLKILKEREKDVFKVRMADVLAGTSYFGLFYTLKKCIVRRIFSKQPFPLLARSDVESKWRKLYGDWQGNKDGFSNPYGDTLGKKYWKYHGRGTTPLFLEQNLVEYSNVGDEKKWAAKTWSECGKAVPGGAT